MCFITSTPASNSSLTNYPPAFPHNFGFLCPLPRSVKLHLVLPLCTRVQNLLLEHGKTFRGLIPKEN